MDKWKLYDRHNDPHELTNVYHDASYKSIVAELTDQLAELRIKYKDSPELDQEFIEKYKDLKRWDK